MNKTLLSATIAIACALSSAATRAAEPGETTIGGKGYFDLTNIDETSNGAKTDASGTGLDVKRFYFSSATNSTRVWSANLTTDFNYVSQRQRDAAVRQEGLFRRQVQRRVHAALRLDGHAAGAVRRRHLWQPLHREHARRAIGLEASADWGVHALGKFAGGKAHYAVSAINGNGYKNEPQPSLDLDTRIDFEPIESADARSCSIAPANAASTKRASRPTTRPTAPSCSRPTSSPSSGSASSSSRRTTGTRC